MGWDWEESNSSESIISVLNFDYSKFGSCALTIYTSVVLFAQLHVGPGGRALIDFGALEGYVGLQLEACQVGDVHRRHLALIEHEL